MSSETVENKMMSDSTAAVGISETATLDTQKKAAAIFAIVFGAFLIWGAAYANPITLHNAAHDARHAFGFPCH